MVTTAADTNMLINLLFPDSPHGDESERRLASARGAGPLVICEAVYAELAAGAPDRPGLDEFLASTGIQLVVSTIDVWYCAGRAWRTYRSRRRADPQCPACGETNRVACTRCGRALSFRQHILADFLIGAHRWCMRIAC